jgi:antitoxin Phd
MASTKAAAARVTSMTATDAKNEFGRALDAVLQGGAVVITRHDAPKAVLISFQEYNALKGAGAAQLDRLTGAFDALLADMQRPTSRAAMKAAFGASPKRLGRAAAAAARKRG